jgi:hypothetical protein
MCCRQNSPSAIVVVVKECILDAKAVESARFDRARNDARTSCEGLLDGQRFERIAGKEEDDCREERKEGPPNI